MPWGSRDVGSFYVHDYYVTSISKKEHTYSLFIERDDVSSVIPQIGDQQSSLFSVVFAARGAIIANITDMRDRFSAQGSQATQSSQWSRGGSSTQVLAYGSEISHRSRLQTTGVYCPPSAISESSIFTSPTPLTTSPFSASTTSCIASIK